MSTVPVNPTFKSKADSTKTDVSEKDEVSIEDPIAEIEEAPKSKRRFALWTRKREDLDSIATKPSLFDDPATLEIYRPPSSYENAHRFDPSARWTVREEIVRVIVAFG